LLDAARRHAGLTAYTGLPCAWLRRRLRLSTLAALLAIPACLRRRLRMWPLAAMGWERELDGNAPLLGLRTFIMPG